MTTGSGRSPSRKLIVAFGDSLTVGYRSPTEYEEFPRPVPYTALLTKRVDGMLRQRVASFKVEFLNRGVVGELTDDMVDRFSGDVVGPRPDAVIILGGSNDLGWGMDPSQVAENLSGMYNEALNNGIRPVACTVPSIRGYDEGIRPRLRLNGLIRNCSESRGIVCVDLFTATADPAGRLREEYSNDGLHLSHLGYEAVAETIFSDAVCGMIIDYLEDTKVRPE
ncbi:MAG TPA: GDSL-type esterase/lipase family protein [Nitrososphaerales archaeon]|nr:GDSL-type esterase/lipase family protein [Nitrososphaerales archaeon]